MKLLCFIFLFATGTCSAGEDVTVKCYTHNVSYLEKTKYDKNLEALCKHATQGQHIPDILAFGLQEARVKVAEKGKMSGSDSYSHVKKKLKSYLEGYEYAASDRVKGFILKEEGIFLYVFKKSNRGIEIKKDDDGSGYKGTGGRSGSGRRGSIRLPKTNMGGANKGLVFLKLEVSKNGVSRTMGFLGCHNSCNNAHQNRADFKIANEKVTKANCDVVFSFGDFNPRIECVDSDAGWIRQIEGPEYLPLVQKLNEIITQPQKSADIRIGLEEQHDAIETQRAELLKVKHSNKKHERFLKYLKRVITFSEEIENRVKAAGNTYCMKPRDTFENLIQEFRWSEAPINYHKFRVSYCYEEGSSQFQQKKDKRNLTMSYADRIIWKIGESNNCTVEGLEYRSIVDHEDLDDFEGDIDVRDLQGSDHQPVYGTFKVCFTGRRRRLLGPTRACYRKLPVMERLLELIQRQ